jgi:hypothetical protein
MTKEEIIEQFKEEYFIYSGGNSGYTYEIAKRDGLYYEDDEQEIAVKVDVEELKKAILNDDEIFAEYFDSDADKVEYYDYEAEENAPTVSYLAPSVGLNHTSIFPQILGYFKRSGNWSEFVPIMSEDDEREREAEDEVYYQIWKTKEEIEPVKDEYGTDVFKGEKYIYMKSGYLFDYVEAV